MPSKSPTSPSASQGPSANSSTGGATQSEGKRPRRTTQKAPSVPTSPPAAEAPRIEMRRSEVHGNGVFALQDLKAGEVLIEYTGEVISWKEALRRHPHDPTQPHHTFYFHIDDKHVIDGRVHGNDAKWINHSCDPNCMADEQHGRIFITALRDIQAGEELNYDYGLVIDEPYTPELLADFPCWCGSETCRGTLLSPHDDDAPGQGGKDKKKKKKKKAKEKKEKAEKKAKAKKREKKTLKAESAQKDEKAKKDKKKPKKSKLTAQERPATGQAETKGRKSAADGDAPGAGATTTSDRPKKANKRERAPQED